VLESDRIHAAEAAAAEAAAAAAGGGSAAAPAAPAPARAFAACGAAARPDSGRLLVCSRCLGTRFCGAECQRAHWPAHKAACHAAAAARGG
jgi:hypothetical protein